MRTYVSEGGISSYQTGGIAKSKDKKKMDKTLQVKRISKQHIFGGGGRWER